MSLAIWRVTVSAEGDTETVTYLKAPDALTALTLVVDFWDPGGTHGSAVALAAQRMPDGARVDLMGAT